MERNLLKRRGLLKAFGLTNKKTKTVDEQVKSFVKRTSDTKFCSVCGNFKNSKEGFREHYIACMKSKIQKPNNNHYCLYCNYEADSKLQLNIHVGNHHMCTVCSFKGSKAEISTHQHTPQYGLGKTKIKTKLYTFKKIPSFEGFVLCYRHKNEHSYLSLATFMNEFKPSIKIVFKDGFKTVKCMKAQINVHATFKRISGIYDNENETRAHILNSNLEPLLNVHNFEDFYQSAFQTLENSINIFQEFGSGWVLETINGVDVRLAKFKPIKGGNWLPTPKPLASKHCLVNVHNQNSDCFKWAFLAALHPCKKNQNSARTSSYQQHVRKYNFNCLKYPVNPIRLNKFETINNVAVNVFLYDVVDGVLPHFISKFNYSGVRRVNLLLLTSLQSVKSKHYVAIRNISALFGKQGHHKKTICYRCIQSFPSSMKLYEHELTCSTYPAQKIIMPQIKYGLNNEKKKPEIYFKNIHKQMKVPYAVFCDFESIIRQRKSTRTPSYKTSSKALNKSPYTVKTAKHIPCGYAYVVVRQDGKVVAHRVYRGKKCVEFFLKEMSHIADQVMKIYDNPQKMIFTKEDQISFDNQIECGICGKPFENAKDKVRDHCRITSVYRTAAHSLCNLLYVLPKKLPIISHNFQGYDSKIIIRGFKKFGNNFWTIAKSTEQLMSICVDKLLFLDSLQFLKESLGRLVTNLDDEGKGKFPISEQIFSSDQIQLLKRKGVYPYEYMDSFNKFKEKTLPQRKYFYNSLLGKNISKSDYQYVKTIYKSFKMKNLGDLHNQYVLSDAAFLADIFCCFRDMSLKYYKLDPLHYFSVAGLAFDSMLKMTDIKLEQITDINMYTMFENSIRGGLSMISLREAHSNNHYMDDFNPNEESSYILYTDKNNLYGEAMNESLGTGDFRFLSKKELKELDVKNIGSNSDKGYILEVDLEYGQHLHDAHNAFPLCPEKMSIPKARLGPYQSFLLEKLNLKYDDASTKLVAHLGPRKKYCIYYKNLQYCMQMGMKLTKVWRVLEFSQSKWLSEFVQFNTEKRMNAKNEMEKNLFKLIVNSIYGHFLISKRKHIDLKIANSWTKFSKLINSPFSTGFKQVGSNIFLVTMRKKTAKLDSAIYNAFLILEISKLSMQRFHYGKMVKWFGNRADLLFHDTDSLTYHIKSPDVYKELLPHLKHFDTSDYDKSHFLHSNKNKNVIGKVKDEGNGKIFSSFVGLGAKSYSIIGDEIRKMAVKGIPKRIQNSQLKHEIFLKVLHTENKVYSKMNLMRSFKQKMYNIKVRRTALHAFCSKRFIRSDGVRTRAWGHYKNDEWFMNKTV